MNVVNGVSAVSSQVVSSGCDGCKEVAVQRYGLSIYWDCTLLLQETMLERAYLSIACVPSMK